MDSREGSPNSDRSNNSSSAGSSAERSRDPNGESAPPKKRSRKGQAFKLDQISARLQQRTNSDDEDNAADHGDENEGARSRLASISEAATSISESPVAIAGNNGAGLNDIHDSLAELNNEVERRWSESSRDRRASEDATISGVDASPAESWENAGSPKHSGSGGSPASPRAGSGKRKSSIIKRYDGKQQNGAGNNENNGNNDGNGDAAAHGSPRESPSPSPSRSTPSGETTSTMAPGEKTTPAAAGTPGTAATQPKREEGREKTFECAHCDMSFRNCVMYSVHMGFHGYQDPFHCNMCGESFKDKVEFFLHIGRVAHQ